MPIGLILTIITSLLIIVLFLINSKTKRLFSSYWFYSIVSLGFLVYFIAYRWANDLKDLVDGNYHQYFGGKDVLWSKVLLLDMCPFAFVTLSVSLIIDKSRTFASSISYFGIIGGAITIYGQIAFEGVNAHDSSWIANVPSTTWWEYIFLNQAYFLIHFYLLVMSIIVIMNSKGINIIKLIISHGYAIFFFSYISIIVFTMNIKWNATGIVPNDWSSFGEYGVLGSMLNLAWPWDPILVFIFVWILILFMMFIRNLMVLDSRYDTNDLIMIRSWKEKYIAFLVDKNIIKKNDA